MPTSISLNLPAVLVRHKHFPELTYASEVHALWQQFVIRLLESASGRSYFARFYRVWQDMFRTSPENAMTAMMTLLDMELNICSGEVPFISPGDGPLVMIANHPYGIADGVAILSIAERMGRPYRILINCELMKVPEIRPFSLPVRFDDTRDALLTNLETRQKAIELLRKGVTIIVFPAGGVATAARGFGKATDLPWKRFPAKLIQSAEASVLPIYFEGQCSPLFHAASRISPTMRTALLIREFRKRVGTSMNVHIGNVIQWERLSACEGREEMMEILHRKVFSLATQNNLGRYNQNRPF